MLARAVGVVFVLCALAASTSAASAQTAAISDPAGDVGYSFDPVTDLTGLHIVRNGESLTVQATYAAQPPSDRLDLTVSSHALSELDPAVEECDSDWGGTLGITAGDDGALLRVENISGSLTAAAQWSGTTVTYVFSSPTLAQAWAPGKIDPLACVSGSAGGDTVYGAFDGKVIKLTSDGAAGALLADLDRRYGESSSASARCPRAGMSEPDDGAEAFCVFEYRRGQTYRVGGATVYLAEGIPQITRFGSQRLPASLHTCGAFGDHGNGKLRWGEPPVFGFATQVWSTRTPCATARRIALHYTGTRHYRGYTCRTVKHAYEFSRIRCTRPGGRVVQFESSA